MASSRRQAKSRTSHQSPPSPPSSNRARPLTVDAARHALILNAWKVPDAARALEVDPSTLRRLMRSNGLQDPTKSAPVLLRALEAHDWHIGQTAESLGLDPATLRRRVKRAGLADPKKNRATLRRQLEAFDWNVRRTAEHLGVSPRTLTDRIKKLGLSRAEHAPKVDVALLRRATLDELERHGWNRRQAAAALGISPPTLRKRMRKLDIQPPPQPEKPRTGLVPSGAPSPGPSIQPSGPVPSSPADIGRVIGPVSSAVSAVALADRDLLAALDRHGSVTAAAFALAMSAEALTEQVQRRGLLVPPGCHLELLSNEALVAGIEAEGGRLEAFADRIGLSPRAVAQSLRARGYPAASFRGTGWLQLVSDDMFRAIIQLHRLKEAAELLDAPVADVDRERLRRGMSGRRPADHKRLDARAALVKRWSQAPTPVPGQSSRTHQPTPVPDLVERLKGEWPPIAEAVAQLLEDAAEHAAQETRVFRLTTVLPPRLLPRALPTAEGLPDSPVLATRLRELAAILEPLANLDLSSEADWSYLGRTERWARRNLLAAVFVAQSSDWEQSDPDPVVEEAARILDLDPPEFVAALELALPGFPLEKVVESLRTGRLALRPSQARSSPRPKRPSGLPPRPAVVAALHTAKGQRTKAAQILGRSRMQVHRLIQRYAITDADWVAPPAASSRGEDTTAVVTEPPTPALADVAFFCAGGHVERAARMLGASADRTKQLLFGGPASKPGGRQAITRDDLLTALHMAGGSRSEAARVLDRSRMQVHRLIRQWGIEEADWQKWKSGNDPDSSLAERWQDLQESLGGADSLPPRSTLFGAEAITMLESHRLPEGWRDTLREGATPERRQELLVVVLHLANQDFVEAVRLLDMMPSEVEGMLRDLGGWSQPSMKATPENLQRALAAAGGSLREAAVALGIPFAELRGILGLPKEAGSRRSLQR